jgi:hypothetical protein
VLVTVVSSLNIFWMLRYNRTTPTIINAIGDILIGWFVTVSAAEAIDGTLIGLKYGFCHGQSLDNSDCIAWAIKLKPLVGCYLAVVMIFG